MKGLKEKVIFITGGNSGIGEATAIRFAEAGTKVVIAARREDEGNNVINEIFKNGGEAIFIKTDVTKALDVENAIKKTVQHFGSLDFAFNNAGIHLEHKKIHLLEEDIWDKIVDVNLKGTWLCMKYEINEMLKNGVGAIVNMSSMGGLVGNPVVLSPYIASKHGVIGLTKQAALEYATSGIRVNAVSPAVIKTSLIATLPKEAIEPLKMAHPLQRLGETNEVADTVMWLCSSGSSFITGHTIPIDGGYFAQ